MNTTRLFLFAGALALVGACGSSSDNSCVDGGICDGGTFSFDTGPGFVPSSGKYKITAYTKGSLNECGFMFDSAVNSTDPLDWIPVTVDGTTLKIGNLKGTPAAASLGEGPIVGTMAMLTRSNHVKDDAPSTCQYDEMVMSTATLDAPSKTIGVSVTDARTNRTTCDLMPTVKNCTSTWSWRLSPTP